jgi:hypothetical protein
LDRSLDLFGVHFRVKYIDPSDRAKGGKFNLVIDDMKKLFPRAHSKAIDVLLDFDGGDSKTDGMFNLKLNYKLTHGDGDGDETGTLTAFRKKDGNMWVSQLKTETTGSLGGAPIIPAAISNLEFKLESDRETKFHFMYVNPSKNRDFHINVDRVPGKQAEVKIKNGERVHDLVFKVKDFDLKKIDGNFEISVKGKSLGESIEGSITGEANAKGNRIKVDFEKGNKKLIQIDSKIRKDLSKLYFETKTKYSLMGGVLSGSIKIKYENKQLNIVNELGGDTLELRVKIIPGEMADIECKKNGVSMWTYKTQRTTINNADKYEMDLTTDMTLNPDSMFHSFLDRAYPYGAFEVRKNVIKIFVDKQNRNLLLPKFFVDIKLFKEGDQVVNLEIDSRNRPYRFMFEAPNVFKRWNIQYPKIEATLDHDIGSSLKFNTNVGGGIEINADRAMNDQGGRDINILTKKAGKQMMKVNIHTEKEDNDNQLLIKLKDSVEIDSDSALFRRIVSNYRLLTPFNKRTGEYEIFVNKKERNVLAPKFHVRGKVVKDGERVMQLNIATDESPYKAELYLPALLNKIYPDMDEYKMTIDHNPGQSLEIQTNGKKFQSLKIARTGSGNERTVEINGEQLASGDYTLTDNSFTTKLTRGGDWLQPTITWEGALPKSRAEAEAFFLTNHVKVSATGSKRNFDVDLSWKSTKPDWDWSTPENMKLDLNAKGNSPRWGEWSLSRDVTLAIANKVIQLDISGLSQFSQGAMATDTPIETEVHVKYLMNQRDLQGKLSKIINGKEYSVDFPEGFGVMPQIKMGQ